MKKVSQQTALKGALLLILGANLAANVNWFPIHTMNSADWASEIAHARPAGRIAPPADVDTDDDVTAASSATYKNKDICGYTLNVTYEERTLPELNNQVVTSVNAQRLDGKADAVPPHALIVGSLDSILKNPAKKNRLDNSLLKSIAKTYGVTCDPEEDASSPADAPATAPIAKLPPPRVVPARRQQPAVAQAASDDNDDMANDKKFCVRDQSGFIYHNESAKITCNLRNIKNLNKSANADDDDQIASDLDNNFRNLKAALKKRLLSANEDSIDDAKAKVDDVISAIQRMQFLDINKQNAYVRELKNISTGAEARIKALAHKDEVDKLNDQFGDAWKTLAAADAVALKEAQLQLASVGMSPQYKNNPEGFKQLVKAVASQNLQRSPAMQKVMALFQQNARVAGAIDGDETDLVQTLKSAHLTPQDHQDYLSPIENLSKMMTNMINPSSMGFTLSNPPVDSALSSLQMDTGPIATAMIASVPPSAVNQALLGINGAAGVQPPFGAQQQQFGVNPAMLGPVPSGVFVGPGSLNVGRPMYQPQPPGYMPYTAAAPMTYYRPY